MFWFNTNKYNFWPVYEAIKMYYPIGISKDEDSRFLLYRTYPGYKALVKLLDDNFHNTDNWQSRWKSFETEIQFKTYKKFVGTTYGQVPCFSAYIEIEKTAYDDITRTKELHFFVSLLGPFYTVIGQDKSEVKIEGNEERNGMRARNYQAVHYLVVSPEREYTDSFELLCTIIEERFSGHRFVPFYIYNQKITGLEIFYNDMKSNFIFNALFFPSIDFNSGTIGDEGFKGDDWIVEGYVDDGSRWYAFPPNLTEEQIQAAIEKSKL